MKRSINRPTRADLERRLSLLGDRIERLSEIAESPVPEHGYPYRAGQLQAMIWQLRQLAGLTSAWPACAQGPCTPGDAKPQPTDLERVLDLLERAETQLTAYEQGADTWSEIVRDIRSELAHRGRPHWGFGGRIIPDWGVALGLNLAVTGALSFVEHRVDAQYVADPEDLLP